MLEIRQLFAADDLGLSVLNGVNVSVRPGEIVGIAGVSGNGEDELVEVLAGQRPAERGSIEVGGTPYRATRLEPSIRLVGRNLRRRDARSHRYAN